MITLREMLGFIDFDMEIIDGTDEFKGEKVIRLIDRQKENLEGIEGEQFSTDDDFVAATIIDRLEIYWDDYIVEPLARNVKLPMYTAYEKIYKANIEDGFDKNDDYMRCLYHLMYPTEVICVTNLENSFLADIKGWKKLVDKLGVQICYQFADDLEEYCESTDNETDRYGEQYEYVPEIVRVYEGFINVDDFIREIE